MNYLKYLFTFALIIDTIGLNLTNQTNSTVPLRQSTTLTATPITSSASRFNSYFDFFISMKNQPK